MPRTVIGSPVAFRVPAASHWSEASRRKALLASAMALRIAAAASAGLVSAQNLARWAGRLGLSSQLRLGRGEALTGGAAKESILATAFEAVVAAVYLDLGLPAAQQLIARLVDLPDGSGGTG